jgi:CRP-like cAMP-binding protein
MMPSGTVFRNRLLGSLRPADLSLVCKFLTPVELPIEMALEEPNEPIKHAYFLENGLASVVAGKKERIEVGLIGREGMSGLAIVMGCDRSVNNTFIQGAGAGFRIGAAHLRSAMKESQTLRLSLLRYAQMFATQVTQTALANGRATIEARLARWLLMAQDRFDDRTFPFTHRFLALMLGVRRPGVTVALHMLEGHRLIKATRGMITVTNRAGLETRAAGTYGIPEAEYERLFGVAAAAD